MVSSEAVLQFVFVASRIWRKGPRVAPWARGAGRGARGAGRHSCFCISVSPYTDIFAGVVSFCYPAPRSTHLCISKSLYLYSSVSPYLRWRCKSRLPVSSPYARDSSLIKQHGYMWTLADNFGGCRCVTKTFASCKVSFFLCAASFLEVAASTLSVLFLSVALRLCPRVRYHPSSGRHAYVVAGRRRAGSLG